MTQTQFEGLRITPEHLAQRETDREVMKSAMATTVPDTAVLKIIKSPRKYQELFQDNPDEKCTFTLNKNRKFKNRSHTNSRESQQHGASKEREILKRNG